MKDIYGNVYTTATNVTVTERKKSAGDFDWDEAVIYFAVTDRFFDGDASNNDAYGVGDYNTGEKGGSSYHGGDFAGLNQKLKRSGCEHNLDHSNRRKYHRRSA